MRFHAHAHAAALLTSAVLAQGMAVNSVSADSGVGFDTALGNALNPAPINPTTAGRWMDEEGMGTRVPAARTPTGQLYNIPLDPGEEPEAKEGDKDWKTSASVETGAISTRGDDRSQGFRVYKDDAAGFHQVHQAARLGEADAQLALQHRGRAEL